MRLFQAPALCAKMPVFGFWGIDGRARGFEPIATACTRFAQAICGALNHAFGVRRAA